MLTHELDKHLEALDEIAGRRVEGVLAREGARQDVRRLAAARVHRPRSTATRARASSPAWRRCRRSSTTTSSSRRRCRARRRSSPSRSARARGRRSSCFLLPLERRAARDPLADQGPARRAAAPDQVLRQHQASSTSATRPTRSTSSPCTRARARRSAFGKRDDHARGQRRGVAGLVEDHMFKSLRELTKSRSPTTNRTASTGSSGTATQVISLVARSSGPRGRRDALGEADAGGARSPSTTRHASPSSSTASSRSCAATAQAPAQGARRRHHHRRARARHRRRRWSRQGRVDQRLQWQMQLRYYWDEDDRRLRVRQTNATLPYGYEYLGNCDVAPRRHAAHRPLLPDAHRRAARRSLGGAPATARRAPARPRRPRTSPRRSRASASCSTAPTSSTTR